MYELLGSISLSILFGIWVFTDAKKRSHKTAIWTLGTVFMTPLVVPNYFAKRNLNKGEIRKGGTTWHVMRNFALYWSFFMLLVAFFTTISELNVTGSVRDDAFGIVDLTFIWGIPAGGAFLLGIYLRNPSEVEEGPTGSLLKNEG